MRTALVLRLMTTAVLLAVFSALMTGRGPMAAPTVAHAGTTDPAPRAPDPPGVFWGIGGPTVSWNVVPGAAGYVVTVKALGSGTVKTYKNDVFPVNRLQIYSWELPPGAVGGYNIRVQARAKNGKLSAYSSVPVIPPAKVKNGVKVKKGDNAAIRKAVKNASQCEKAGGVVGGLTVTGQLILAFFAPEVTVTATMVGATFLSGTAVGVLGCIAKKIDPSLP